jgi:hypothetical protein
VDGKAHSIVSGTDAERAERVEAEVESNDASLKDISPKTHPSTARQKPPPRSGCFALFIRLGAIRQRIVKF